MKPKQKVVIIIMTANDCIT